MASIIRPTLLRPTLGALAAKRATAIPFTPATASAFLTTSSYKTQPASQACMPPSRGASFAHPKPAAFHTTTKREILPPLPRTCTLYGIEPWNKSANKMSRATQWNWYSSRRNVLKHLNINNVIVNDAAIVPDPSPSHGAYHWTFERFVLGCIPQA